MGRVADDKCSTQSVYRLEQVYLYIHAYCKMLYCCPCSQMSLIQVAGLLSSGRHRTISIPAEEAKEIVDRTVGVSDVVLVVVDVLMSITVGCLCSKQQY